MHRLATTALALALVLAAPAAAGTYFESRMTIDGPQMDQQMKVHGWVEGESAKVVFEESDNPLAGAGTYLLTNDGAQTVYLVDPDEKTYMVYDLDALAGMAGAMLQGLGPMLKIDVADHSTKKVLEEAGPEILGHATTHHRYESRYTTQVKVFGMKQESRTETTQDVWSTDGLAAPGFAVWLRKDPPQTGIESLDRMIAAEMANVEGFPLKSTTVSKSDDGKGNVTTTTTTSEVTALREEAAPAGTFEMPSGYTRTEMPDLSGMFQPGGR